jgi:hypothetical protein
MPGPSSLPLGEALPVVSYFVEQVRDAFDGE